MRKLITFLLLASPAFAQWANVSTNALGVRYDASVGTPTDGYGIVYDFALKAYKAALSGGSPTNVPWSGTAAAGSAGVQHLAIPLYIYPDANWTTVGNTATKTSIIISDDSNGDPPSADPNYVAAIAAAKTAGLTVLCYVPTNYAADPIATVEAKIDKAYTFYSPDGIFFDQAASAAGSVPYYTTLYNYVRAKAGSADLVALNPGTTCAEGYAAVSDIICTFEGTYASYLSYVPDTWTRKYNSIKFWHIVHDTTPTNLANAIKLTKSNGAGWVNITDQTSYGVLAVYLAAEARQIGYAAGDDARLPPPPLIAGRIPYDTTTGVTWTATGGTTTQVLHGGSTPAYGKVVVADISSTGATSGQVPTADGVGGTSWLSVPGGGGSGVVGFFAKSAGVTLSGTPTTIDVDQGLTATVTGATYRITPTYGSPSSVSSANADGTAQTFARSDHVHTIAAGTVTNAMVNAAAAIVYSKLALTASIVNADVASGAAIAYSKLALTTSIVNGDISASAAIAYSKLALTGAIVNSDINASAAIAYSKLSLTGSVVVADVASSAKTGTGAKVVTDTGSTFGTPTISDYVTLADQGGASGAAGRLQRNGANLSWGSSGTARNVILDNDSRLTDLRVATTTASFVIPAIGSSVSVTVTSGAGTTSNGGVLIGDNVGGHVMAGIITTGGGTTALTVANAGMLSGAPGQTMLSGAVIAPSIIPYISLGANGTVLQSNGSIGVYVTPAGTGVPVLNQAPTLFSAALSTSNIPDYVSFTDQSADAGATGRLQRNGANLSFHDGTAARNLVKDNDSRLSDARTPNSPASSVSGGYVTRSSTNLLYAPAISNRCFCYESSVWTQKTIPDAGITVACTGLSNSTDYYLYVYDSSGTLTLDLSTTATTTQNGIKVKTGVTNRTFIAQCRSNGSGAITSYAEDATTQLICNQYNRRSISLFKNETTSSWTYALTTIRSLNNSTANRLQFVTLGETFVEAKQSFFYLTDASNNIAQSWIGLDSTSASSNTGRSLFCASSPNLRTGDISYYAGLPSSGFHFLQALESCSTAATITIYGVWGTPTLLSGIRMRGDF